MSSKLNFEFVSPMASIFSGEVDSVLIPAKEGDAEILPQAPGASRNILSSSPILSYF